MEGLGSYIIYQRPDTRELVRIYCPSAPGTLMCQGMRDKERSRLEDTYGRKVPVWVERVGEEQYVSFSPFLFGTVIGILTSLMINIWQKSGKREV